MQVTKMLQL